MEASRGRSWIWASILVVGALAAWLWPLGVGGRMPVGGDATRFSIGLMAEYDRALAERRLPLWNARWGYGFPGLAESQMGVYYPPHVVLYGLLGTEAAYTASLVLHTFWAALGVLWASRRLGMSPSAGVIAAIAWAGSGFFSIHLAHPWAVTVGSWMPWAWGLSWGVATGAGWSRIRQGVALAAVLGIQVLPGHFQIAYITQVSTGVLVLAGTSGGLRGRARSLSWLAVAGLLGMLLASAQLLPTMQLARAAESDRDCAYLSGFATPPPMLVSYVAPGLFHGSPLWRPILWDPMHASPEEHLGYVGIVPLILALGVLWRQARSDPATRSLGWVAVGTLLLSFGPYFPGFQWLIELPGFSFFRAPARWGVATQLALAMLAGLGMDRIRGGAWLAPGRSLVMGTLASGLMAMVAVAAVEVAAQAVQAPAASGASKALRSMLDRRPWPTAPEELRRMREGISGPSRDALVIEGLLKRGEDPASARWERDRKAIYVEELAPTAVVLMGVLGIAVLGRIRPAAMLPALLVVTALDVVGNAHARRLVESGPIAPLTEQSAVLAAMAALPDGSRVLAGLGNLPMAAGASALESYRTLDRPIQGELTALAASARPGDDGPAADALRAVGARLVARPEAGPREDDVRLAHDEALPRWLYGQEGAARLGARGASYALWEPTDSPAVAWFLSGQAARDAALATPGDAAGRVLSVMAAAQPLPLSSRVPEEIEVSATLDAAGLILLTILDDPEWVAFASRDGGPFVAVPIVRAFASAKGAGWMAIPMDEPGRWVLRLQYRGDQAAIGRQISIGVGVVLLLGYGIGRLAARRRPARIEEGEGGVQ